MPNMAKLYEYDSYYGHPIRLRPKGTEIYLSETED
jgi:hypothetical protein